MTQSPEDTAVELSEATIEFLRGEMRATQVMSGRYQFGSKSREEWSVKAERFRDAANAIAALSQPVPIGAVKVKPLEWRIFCSASGNCDAETPFGQYVIQSEPEGETPRWCMYLPNENDAHTAHPTLKAAKAAAQADYEARIRSAIAPATLAVGDMVLIEAAREPALPSIEAETVKAVAWADPHTIGAHWPYVCNAKTAAHTMPLFASPQPGVVDALREALKQINVVCSVNAPAACRHDLALKFVADVAAKALAATGGSR